MSENRTSVVAGQSVVYVDEHGVSHDALVTIVHGAVSKEAQDNHYREQVNKGLQTPLETLLAMEWWVPAINLVYVSDDVTKRDPYGLQIVRASSVSHKSTTTAAGRYWH